MRDRSVILDLGRTALLHLAEAIESGRVAVPIRASQLRPYLDSRQAEAVAVELEHTRAGGPPRCLVGALQLLAAARAEAQGMTDRVELVWSGLEGAGAVTRDTAVVVQELFFSAKRRVLLSSYAVDRGDKARALLGTLAKRLDEDPGFEVELYVNIHPDGSDRPAQDQIDRFVRSFRKDVWPGVRPPRVWHYPRSLVSSGGLRSSLHAKCIIVDDRRVLVTSANLTDAAQHRNLEAGLLVDDVRLAEDLRRQFEDLEECGELVPLLF